MSAFIMATKQLKKTKFEEQTITNETATIRSRPSNMNVEMPFNIDEIFQADVDRFGQLKEVIKYILDRLEQQSSYINDVETKMITKLMQIEK